LVMLFDLIFTSIKKLRVFQTDFSHAFGIVKILPGWVNK
jgi:hypothetical protein